MIGEGTVIAGRYELIEPVGQGGMGTVWRALHVRLEQPVAVKFIARDIVTPQLAKRFLREPTPRRRGSRTCERSPIR